MVHSLVRNPFVSPEIMPVHAIASSRSIYAATLFDSKRLCPAKERGVIWHRKAREGQIAQTLGAALLGTRCASIDGLHAKQDLNQDVAAQTLATTRGYEAVEHFSKDGFIDLRRHVPLVDSDRINDMGFTRLLRVRLLRVNIAAPRQIYATTPL